MKNVFCAFFLIAVMFCMSVPSEAQISGAGGKEFTQEYIYDFAVHGGAVGNVSLKNPRNALPSGAVILSAHYTVLTAMTSGGSATVSIGDAASTARYLALTAFDNAAYDANVAKALSSGMPITVSSANISSPSISIAVAALTAGKIRIVFRGYVPKG